LHLHAAEAVIAEVKRSRPQPIHDLQDRAIPAAGFTVFTLSGRIETQQLADLKQLFDTEYRNTILDLADVRLVDHETVKLLRSCEARAMKIENCPEYIREWIAREKE
jgi:hypothetical protein